MDHNLYQCVHAHTHAHTFPAGNRGQIFNLARDQHQIHVRQHSDNPLPCEPAQQTTKSLLAKIPALSDEQHQVSSGTPPQA